jgi:hypothetical protein
VDVCYSQPGTTQCESANQKLEQKIYPRKKEFRTKKGEKLKAENLCGI